MSLPPTLDQRAAEVKAPVVEIITPEAGSLQRTVAYMLAQGKFPEDIEKATGLGRNQVLLLIKRDEVKALVRKIVAEEKEIDPRILARSFLPAAIQLLGDVVMGVGNPTLAHRLSAAKEIISRNLGTTPLGPEQKTAQNPVEEYNKLLAASVAARN